MPDHDTQLNALFGRPPTEDERAAATAQAARLEAGIADNPIVPAGNELIALPQFSVPAP